MSKESKIIWVNNWIQVFQENNFTGVKEPWCRNEGVAILPFVLKKNRYYFLLVKENNPIFENLRISKYSTITGGLENNDHRTAAEHEMIEEAGIDIINKKVKIHYLGYNFGSKTCTKQWHWYAVDLTKLNLDLKKTYNGIGDGTELEKEISAKFKNEIDLMRCNDIYCLSIFAKLYIFLKAKKMLPIDFKNKIKDKKWQKQINQKVKINQLFIFNQTIDDWFEEIPLHYAVKIFYFKIVELLIAKGANVNVEDEEGKTPLYYAIKNSDCEMIELLIAKGANVNIEDEEGVSLLYVATTQGDLITISSLLSKGANVNIEDEEGKTPLYYAIKNSDFKIVELLIAKGANANIEDKKRKTPLYYAIKNSDCEMIELLIAKGANVNIEDKYELELLTKKRKNVEEQNCIIMKSPKHHQAQPIKKNSFVFNQSEINLININQPSTSGYKPSSPKM